MKTTATFQVDGKAKPPRKGDVVETDIGSMVIVKVSKPYWGTNKDGFIAKLRNVDCEMGGV